MYDIYDLFRISLGERERGGVGEREREMEGKKGGRKKEGDSLSLFLFVSLYFPSPLPSSLREEKG